MPKHRIPLGTKVAFKGSPTIYETCDYQAALVCEPNCPEQDDPEHECYEEPYMCVRETIVHFKPVSELRLIFDGKGHFNSRPATSEEKTVT